MEVYKHTGEHACRMGLAASIISLVTLVCWLAGLCVYKADQDSKGNRKAHVQGLTPGERTTRYS